VRLPYAAVNVADSQFGDHKCATKAIDAINNAAAQNQPCNGADGPPAFRDVTEKDDSTIVATINPRTNDGYRCQLVARIVPESPNSLPQKAKSFNAHADKQDADCPGRIQLVNARMRTRESNAINIVGFARPARESHRSQG
jgi:hypothetical protein